MNITEYHFFHQLKRIPAIEAIWLYGSRARSDNEDRSDMDLAIYCPTATSEDWQRVMEIIEQADTLLKIDYVRFDQLPENKFKENILKFKKVLYEKGSHFMNKEFWQDYFEELGKVLTRLSEALEHSDVAKHDLFRDAAIQRFEFCVELYWKVLKKFLAYEKIEANTPRDVLNKSYQYKLIDDESVWLAMLDDRNRTSHVYKEEIAEQVFSHIKNYWPVMRDTYQSLRKKFYSEK